MVRFVLVVFVLGLCSAQLSEQEKASAVYKAASCTKELEVARAVRDSAQSKTNELSETVTKLEAEIHALRGDVRTCQEGTAAANEKTRVAEAKLSHCEQAMVQSARDDDAAIRQHSQFAHANEALKAEVAGLRMQLEAARAKVEHAKSEVELLQRDYESSLAEVDALRQDIRSLESARSAFRRTEAEALARQPSPYGEHGQSSLPWEHDHHSPAEIARREQEVRDAHQAESEKRAAATVPAATEAPKSDLLEVAENDEREAAPVAKSPAEKEL
jgi:hypothetical protein